MEIQFSNVPRTLIKTNFMYCTTVRSIKRPGRNPIPPPYDISRAPALAHRSAYFIEPFIHEKNSSLSDLVFFHSFSSSIALFPSADVI